MPERNAEQLVQAAAELCHAVEQLRFAAPVAYVYNPLNYAWPMHEAYLRRYGGGRKKSLFLGMNPGPWGMAQTGVPFGEIASVRDWLKLDAPVAPPKKMHPKRMVEGLACSRSEVSGARLWGLFSKRFGDADAFFREHFVVNYCPLAFMEDSSRNRTPDKLPADERQPLEAACDRHLAAVIEATRPAWVIGVGKFAEKAATRVVASMNHSGSSLPGVGCILHPSPASPAANKDWAGTVTRQLQALGLWA